MDLPCAGWMVYLGVDGSCKQHLKLPVLPMRVTIMLQNSGGSITRDAADLRSPDPLDRERAARRIWVRLEPQLLKLVRRRLNPRIRVRTDGNEREVLTHPERLILTHLVLQDSRSGQGRQFRFTPPFGSSWTSSTRESGSSRRSSRRSGNDASGGPKAPRSSARPGRSGSTR